MFTDSESDSETITLYLLNNRRKRKRKMWVRPMFLQREQWGEFYHLVPQLKADSAQFFEYYRMSPESYELLVSIVKPLVTIYKTNFREPIPFEEWLTVTLRYLATGESFHSLSFRFRISHNRMSVMINILLSQIYNGLKEKYLKFPDTAKFLEIAEGFKNKKKFPNCLGAIEGETYPYKETI
ncbi:hypothetical protein PPYR_00434 [Photinus pyralis]|uniref:Transposase Helix-turn-helix domain-containing protein n=1 Tax=Photinus pyralis TaxID=7054 RepID=A0A5N4B1L1_PHOPY|nr:hypothetical protein PPYR_00434 [Photinus pyralis]